MAKTIVVIAWCVALLGTIPSMASSSQSLPDAQARVLNAHDYTLENVKNFKCETMVNKNAPDKSQWLYAHAFVEFANGDVFSKTLRFCSRFKDCGAECGAFMDSVFDSMFAEKKKK